MRAEPHDRVRGETGVDRSDAVRPALAVRAPPFGIGLDRPAGVEVDRAGAGEDRSNGGGEGAEELQPRIVGEQNARAGVEHDVRANDRVPLDAMDAGDEAEAGRRAIDQ